MLLLNSVDQIRKKLHIVYIVFFFLQRISFSIVYLFVYNLKKNGGKAYRYVCAFFMQELFVDNNVLTLIILI